MKLKCDEPLANFNLRRYIGVFTVDAAALGLDPDDAVVEVAYTLAVLASPVAALDWGRRVLRRHGRGKLDNDKVGSVQMHIPVYSHARTHPHARTRVRTHRDRTRCFVRLNAGARAR